MNLTTPNEMKNSYHIPHEHLGNLLDKAKEHVLSDDLWNSVREISKKFDKVCVDYYWGARINCSILALEIDDILSSARAQNIITTDYYGIRESSNWKVNTPNLSLSTAQYSSKSTNFAIDCDEKFYFKNIYMQINKYKYNLNQLITKIGLAMDNNADLYLSGEEMGLLEKQMEASFQKQISSIVPPEEQELQELINLLRQTLKKQGWRDPREGALAKVEPNFLEQPSSNSDNTLLWFVVGAVVMALLSIFLL